MMTIPLLFCCIFLESVLALVDFQATSHLLECRICREALNLEDCRETELCSRNEECYMDSIVTPQLQVIFNGGCRSKTICRAAPDHTGKRAIEYYITCSSCCNATKTANSTECNTNLCGLKSMNTPSNQCYSCGYDDDARQGAVTDPSHCRKIKFCADDEVCRATTQNTAGTITYEFGCAKLLQCQILTIANLELLGVNTGVDLQHLSQTGEIIGRKRQVNVCDICCGNGLCNYGICESVRTRLVYFAKAQKFNYTSLRLIL